MSPLLATLKSISEFRWAWAKPRKVLYLNWIQWFHPTVDHFVAPWFFKGFFKYISPAVVITWNFSIKNFSLATVWQLHNTVYITKVEEMYDFIHFKNQTLTSSIRPKYNHRYIQSLTNFYKVSPWGRSLTYGSKKSPFLPLFIYFYHKHTSMWWNLFTQKIFIEHLFFWRGAGCVLPAGDIDMCSGFS